MLCALCQEERELRESHIIPEFMFRTMYDEIHRFHVLSDKRPNQLAQKGLRQKLLCDSCEQHLGRHERYVSLLMTGAIPLEVEPRESYVIFRGIDYKALRLFQLSVLWRSSICDLPFFSEVSLGQHEERVRQLLLNDDPGLSWQYGCLMFALIHAGAVVDDLMVQPTKVRLDSVPCYRFVFGGHFWLFFVANHQHPRKIESASLDPSGELRIRMKNVAEIKYITEFGRTLIEQGKV